MNVRKLLWMYSLPAIVGAMIASLYNIIDRIFIGQGVGPMAISGLALTFPFMNFLSAFSMLVGAGAASRISIRLGEGDKDRAEKILANALMLTFIITGGVKYFHEYLWTLYLYCSEEVKIHLNTPANLCG